MTSTYQLKKKQDELIDKFILNPEQIEIIMKQFINKRKEFHNYSLGNLISAHFQLLERGKTEGVELLAPYKRWEKINRHVKRGEKALYILAPRIKKIEDENGEVIEEKIWFKKVPVFDLCQTEGEPFEEDYTKGNPNITFTELKNKINIPILESEKQLTRGYTDGNKIWISKHLSDMRKICVLFHELAHYYLHFGDDRKELKKDVKELEAESVSFMIASSLGIENGESGAYIKNWAGENSVDLIKGRGNKLIKLASKLIKDLGLNNNIINDDEHQEDIVKAEV